MSGRRLAIATVLAAALAVPATAQSPVVYRGKTSQGRNITIKATPEGDVTEIRMRWRARCRERGYVFRGATGYSDPIEQSGTSLSDSGTYRSRLGRRTVATITGRLRGTFESGRGGEGTVRYGVRVRRRGRLIDVCRSGRIRWSVARSG
jgi:hypothetical protein